MYTILDSKSASELSIRKQGWFSAHYELTDDAYCYGSISFKILSGMRAVAISATDTWIFKREDIFGRTILITDQKGEQIGKITSDRFIRRRFLTLQTGFKAEFYRSSFLSQEFIWESEGYGRIMHIKSFPFNLTDTVYIDPGMAPASVIPLLIFSGKYLTVLIRRRRVVMLNSIVSLLGGAGIANTVGNTRTLYQ